MNFHDFLIDPTRVPMAESLIKQGWGVLVVLVIWDIAWKGLGLWKAARNKDTAWFVVMLIVNSIGILPILYVYVFGKNKK